jgi:mRNA interferase RelE/StbE
MFTVQLKPQARKQLGKLYRRDQLRIAAAIDGLRHDPFVGKKLEGELYGLWAVRVVPFRIIYAIDKKIITVTVVAIGDRKDVYRKLKR